MHGSNGKHERNDAEVIELEGIPLKYLKIPGWEVDSNGIKRERAKGDKNVTEVACPHPVIIIASLRNLDTGKEKIRLAYMKKGKWREVTAGRSTIASRQGIISLADHGIMVNSENAKYLIEYLHDLERFNMDIIPQIQSIGRLGWIDNKSFSPYNDISFDGDICTKDMYHAVAPYGNASDWISVAELARRDVRSRVVLNASCASCLMWKLGKLPFILHLWGNTGTGKTVALQFAASVWGDPAKLAKTYNSTEVGLEKVASFMHSLPLLLDELQVRKADLFLESIIYMLTEGKSRGRGTKDGGSEMASCWSNTIISTGEIPITSELSSGGMKNRTIEIHIREPLFEGKAAQVSSIVNKTYGHMGKALIAKIISEEKKSPQLLMYQYEKFRMYIDRMPCSQKYSDKQLTDLELLAMADFQVSLYMGINKDEAELQAVQFMADFIIMLTPASDIDQGIQAEEWLRQWIVQNMQHFSKENDFRDPKYGLIEKEGMKLTVYVITGFLRDAMQKEGLNPTKMINAWTDSGLIERPNDNKHNGMQKRIDGVNVRCYKIIIQSDEDTKNE